jgi:hypothetical protein
MEKKKFDTTKLNKILDKLNSLNYQIENDVVVDIVKSIIKNNI